MKEKKKKKQVEKNKGGINKVKYSSNYPKVKYQGY